VKRGGRAEVLFVIALDPREDDDRNTGQHGILFLLAAERPPIHDGHAEVEQDDVRIAAIPEVLERFLSVVRLGGAESLELEEFRHQPRQVAIVIHDKDGRRHPQTSDGEYSVPCRGTTTVLAVDVRRFDGARRVRFKPSLALDSNASYGSAG